MSIEEIINEASTLSDVPVSDILSRKKTDEVNEVRQFVCWRAYREGNSYVAIGKALGRSHATVMHNVKQFYNRIETNQTRLSIKVYENIHGEEKKILYQWKS
jgi:chromosomal replication initiation ATPase DnaA